MDIQQNAKEVKAVSISLGHSNRNKKASITLLGKSVIIERIGTDGDLEKAKQMFKDLDGKCDAFGLGGTELGYDIEGIYYPLHSVADLVSGVKRTPYCDGSGIRSTLEKSTVGLLESRLSEYLDKQGRRVFFPTATDRYQLVKSFASEPKKYEMYFGDLMTNLGIPYMGISSLYHVQWLAWFLLPVVSRLPFHWIYPVGENQNIRSPKATSYYNWATIVAGDCHMIRTTMPDKMDGKIVITNTTTREDVELFKKCGVRYLITSTPVIDGRSFGTNMIEAAFIAAAGKGRVLTLQEYEEAVNSMHITPSFFDLQENSSE